MLVPGSETGGAENTKPKQSLLSAAPDPPAWSALWENQLSAETTLSTAQLLHQGAPVLQSAQVPHRYASL